MDSVGADVMRVTTNGNVSLGKANMTLNASTGLLVSSNTSGQSVWFRDGLDVSFYGATILCALATLTAKKLLSTTGLNATCGSNVLDVNATNTAIT